MNKGTIIILSVQILLYFLKEIKKYIDCLDIR